MYFEEEAYKVKMYGKVQEILQARYDSRDSFYGKAKIIEYDGGIYLQSYDTIVARIKNGKLFVRGWYSQTTGRHINEFLLQNGYSKMTKAEMDLGQEWGI